MRVREGGPEDAAGVARMLADLGFPAEEAAVRARLAAVQADARVLVAEDDGTLAGAVASHRMPVLDDDRPVCLVTVLVAAPGMRRRGVGRLLLEAVEREAREAGCGRVVVGTAHQRTSAHAFFRARGYDDTGLRFQKALR